MREENNKEEREPKQNILATVSLVLGIIAIVTGFCFISTLGPSWLLILGVPSVIVGFIALDQINKRDEVGKAVAIAGIVLGVVAVLLWFLGPIVGNLFRTV